MLDGPSRRTRLSLVLSTVRGARPRLGAAVVLSPAWTWASPVTFCARGQRYLCRRLARHAPARKSLNGT